MNRSNTMFLSALVVFFIGLSIAEASTYECTIKSQTPGTENGAPWIGTRYTIDSFSGELQGAAFLNKTNLRNPIISEGVEARWFKVSWLRTSPPRVLKLTILSVIYNPITTGHKFLFFVIPEFVFSGECVEAPNDQIIQYAIVRAL